MELPTPDWRALDAPPIDPAQASLEAVGPPPRRWLMAAVVLALALALVGGAVLVASAPQGSLVLDQDGAAPPTTSDIAKAGAAAGPTSNASPSATPQADLVVDVEGAVSRPGVYRLPAGSRVADAVAAAGGFGPRVDVAAARRALNLAARLDDGAQVVVPGLDDPAAAADPGRGSATASASAGLIDLNRATAEELDSLPGIGPVTSAKIIAAREAQPFRSVDELLSRKLVSSSTFAKVRPLVTVGG